MTNPVILLGTQSNGETLPVQVDATGRLVAEGLQGEQGIQGPPGPEGPPGPSGEIELPPDPWDGAVLGWNNGELVWIGRLSTIQIDYLVIGGGGNHVINFHPCGAGGGAGGFLTSWTKQELPPEIVPNAAIYMDIDTIGQEFSVSVGSIGQASSFAGENFNKLARAGGDGGNRNHGGSGGGGWASDTSDQLGSLGGQPEPGQGFAGGDGIGAGLNFSCWTTNKCTSFCPTSLLGAGGGGAGGVGETNGIGGPAVQSDISGSLMWYCAGGNGTNYCSGWSPTIRDGHDSPGSGGGGHGPAQPGIVFLRFPALAIITAKNGNLSFEQWTQGDDRIVQFNSGSGDIQISVDPNAKAIDLLKYQAQRRFKRGEKALNS